jgi:hypothetical protein
MSLPESYYMEKRLPWTGRHWVILGMTLFVFLVLVPGVAVLLPIWDIDPVDDTGMWISPPPLPDEENAWPLLQEIYNGLDNQDRDFPYDWVHQPEEHQTEITAWLNRTQLMPRFSIVLQKPSCTLPYVMDPDGFGSAYEIGRFGFELFRFHLICQTEAPARYEAWQAALTFLKQCSRQSYGNPGFTQRLTFHQQLFEVLKSDPFIPSFSEEQLGVLLNLYAGLDNDLSDDLLWFHLQQYQQQSKLLHEQGVEGYWEETYGGLPKPPIANWWVFPFVYQPNRTQAWILEALQAELYRLAPDTFPFPAARTAREIKTEDMSHQGISVVLYAVNIHGLVLFSELAPYTHPNLIPQYDLNRRFAMLFLALLKYERATGALPANLSELLPDYLSEIPRDPYDGQPLRYQPDQRRFYSVGRDGIDQGGKDTGSSWNGDLLVEVPAPRFPKLGNP